MKRSYAELLVELGGTAREMPHLMGCPDCDVVGDIEGHVLERCERNPQRLYEERVDEAWRVAWALCRFAGTAQPLGVVKMSVLNRIARKYIQSITEQMSQQTPLAIRLIDNSGDDGSS